MPTDPKITGQLSTGGRWSIMIISLWVTASSFLFINGIAFLIPALEVKRGIPLTEASLLSSMPSWGMVATLVLWGYVLDRVGERIVMTMGSAPPRRQPMPQHRSIRWCGSASICSSVAWQQRVATPPAAGWCPPGFRRSNAAWQWGSVRPRNRWASPWARW